uniref:Uncharacterized protein n=1 Tax=Setaria italica TaxID=4555 RepID=K4A4C5_SETIT
MEPVKQGRLADGRRRSDNNVEMVDEDADTMLVAWTWWYGFSST